MALMQWPGVCSEAARVKAVDGYGACMGVLREGRRSCDA